MTRHLARTTAAIAAFTAALGLAAGLLITSDEAAPGARLLVAVLTLGLAGAIGYVLFLPTARVLRRVSEVADQVAEGDFGQRVMVSTSPTDELVASFNAMADQVAHLIEASAAEHARLEAVFDASTDPMVAVAADTTVQFVNPAAASLFGATEDDIAGRPFIESARDYELDALVRGAAAPGGEGTAAVVSFGVQRVALRALAVPIPGGGDWAALLVLTDLTEVQRLDQVRRDFVSNVSHELRTPLASVRALVETLEDGNVEPGEETKEFLHRINAQVARLSALVTELLDLSRIESGAIELRPETVDLAEIASEAAALLGERAQRANISIVTPPAPGPTAEVDRACMVRVFSNLFDNAIKYSAPGGRVEVEFAEEDRLVAVRVTDDGPGITPAELPRVFERFYKGDQSRTGDGVGLGLAIVKHLVRAHGGTAEASSEEGRGATFTVRIPREFVGRAPAISR